MAEVVAMLTGASNIVLEAAEPLRQLDISDLEDFEVSLTSDGYALLDLGPERTEFIDSVCFYLAYYSLEDDIIILLGKDADLDADWENGRFMDNFRGVWAALDGHYVYLELTYQGEKVNHYSVPVKLNGERCNLIVVYDFEQEAYQVLGARRVLENNLVDKAMTKPKPGDRIATIMQVVSISSDNDDFQEVEVDEFTISEKLIFEDIDLGDGTFFFLFEMTDVQNNSATSEIVTIEVKDGEINFGEI